MAEKSGKTTCPFDVEALGEVMALMHEHDVSEIQLQSDGQKWRLRRGAEPVAYAAPVAPAPQPIATAPAAPAASQEAPPAGGSGDAAEPDNAVYITSPTVGTFYRKPSPDDPVLVAPGDSVNPETIVCLVEAMKVFNQIPAKVSGTIDAVLVDDGEAVEFGTRLFRLK